MTKGYAELYHNAHHVKVWPSSLIGESKDPEGKPEYRLYEGQLTEDDGPCYFIQNGDGNTIRTFNYKDYSDDLTEGEVIAFFPAVQYFESLCLYTPKIWGV
jgi:hypothetical protein